MHKWIGKTPTVARQPHGCVCAFRSAWNDDSWNTNVCLFVLHTQTKAHQSAYYLGTPCMCIVRFILILIRSILCVRRLCLKSGWILPDSALCRTRTRSEIFEISACAAYKEEFYLSGRSCPCLSSSAFGGPGTAIQLRFFAVYLTSISPLGLPTRVWPMTID